MKTADIITEARRRLAETPSPHNEQILARLEAHLEEAKCDGTFGCPTCRRLVLLLA